jgi:ABC-type nickel/cobalt efflux system permease component RcnA
MRLCCFVTGDVRVTRADRITTRGVHSSSIILANEQTAELSVSIQNLHDTLQLENGREITILLATAWFEKISSRLLCNIAIWNVVDLI